MMRGYANYFSVFIYFLRNIILLGENYWPEKQLAISGIVLSLADVFSPWCVTTANCRTRCSIRSLSFHFPSFCVFASLLFLILWYDSCCQLTCILGIKLLVHVIESTQINYIMWPHYYYKNVCRKFGSDKYYFFFNKILFVTLEGSYYFQLWKCNLNSVSYDWDLSHMAIFRPYVI